MIVNFNKKFSIIHIPKTGGTSIKKSLREENIEKDIFFFHKKLHVYPEFFSRSKEIKTQLKFSHLTFNELNKFYPHIFNELIFFDFYVSIRDPKERFISSLIQYFGEEKIDLSKISESQMMPYLEKIISDLTRNNYHNTISMTSFKKQYDYIYFENKKIVKNIYKIDNLNKMIDDINIKYGPYFNKLKKANVTSEIQYNPFKSNFFAKLIPSIIKKKILGSYNFFLPKEYKLFKIKYKNILDSKMIHNFVNNFYEKDIKLYRDL